MKKTAIIVLNYNDADTTRHFVMELVQMTNLDFIVIVDNASTDNSWGRLQYLEALDERVDLLRSRKNGGYGSGNQLGINYAVDRLGADYVIVANPDVHVSEECVEAVRAALDKTKRGAIASAMVHDTEGRETLSYWSLLPFWKDLLDTGLVTRRLFRRWLKAPLSSLPQGATENCRIVDALAGSFFMLRVDRFADGQVHKLFDPQIFLYYEEKVLGEKLRQMNRRAVLVTDASYVHAHSVSIDKSLRSIGDKQAILHQSKLYYYRRYLKAGQVKMAAARIFLGIVLAEVRFLTQVCHLRW